MNLELAKQLSERIDESYVYQKYSGRFMYGAETSGVVCEEGDLFKCFSDIFENFDESNEDDINLIREIGSYLRNYQRDNLGLKTIYY